MRTISQTVRLHDAIQLLEEEKAYKGILLKEQFLISYESLKPINLIRSTFKEISTSPILGDNVLGAVMGLASGYLSKKIVVGGSGNIFRKLIGSVLQFGVANAVAQHPDAIRLIGQFIMQFFHRKNEVNSE